LLSNVSTSALGLLGFQLVIPLIADLEVKAANCEPLGPIAANVGPVDANLYVHVGERLVANLVSALSIFVPVCTDPVKNNELVAELHSRLAFAAELLTRAVSFPVLEYFAITPSRTPTTFFPARVSELLPIA
jgi:hypothetical protein